MTMQGIPSLNNAAAAAGGKAAPAAGSTAAPKPSGPPAEPAPVVPPTAEQVDQAIEALRKAIGPVARDLRFSVDKDTGKTVIKVMDAATEEVIRQIPTEEALAISQALDRMQGVLLKQKA